MNESLSQTDEFSSAIEAHASRYGLQSSAQDISRLREYYEQVLAWNARLHLVAPCSPTEFATRHVLESLLAINHLPVGAHCLDIGSGAGLPIIPCLIVRPDVRATLIESSRKKAVFLREALRTAGAHHRASVIAERFEKIHAPPADVVTCRALDKLKEMLAKIVGWASHAQTLLLFGGEGLREQLEDVGLAYEAFLIPESERRFLFVIKK